MNRREMLATSGPKLIPTGNAKMLVPDQGEGEVCPCPLEITIHKDGQCTFCDEANHVPLSCEVTFDSPHGCPLDPPLTIDPDGI